MSSFHRRRSADLVTWPTARPTTSFAAIKRRLVAIARGEVVASVQRRSVPLSRLTTRRSPGPFLLRRGGRGRETPSLRIEVPALSRYAYPKNFSLVWGVSAESVPNRTPGVVEGFDFGPRAARYRYLAVIDSENPAQAPVAVPEAFPLLASVPALSRCSLWALSDDLRSLPSCTFLGNS